MTAPFPGHWAALLAAPALLAGCEQPDTTAKVDTDRSAVASASASASANDRASLSAKLQQFMPPYPGAAVKSQISKASGDGAAGALIVMETSDPIPKVAAYYDAKAKEAGITPTTLVTDEDGAVRVFGDVPEDGNSARGGMIAIGKSDDGKATEIVVTIGMATDKPEASAAKPVPSAMARLQ